MNIIHILWILFLVIFFALAGWVRKGVMWGVVLALATFLSYRAITGYWEAIMFVPIIGIFILSLMGFIYDSLHGNFV